MKEKSLLHASFVLTVNGIFDDNSTPCWRQRTEYKGLRRMCKRILWSTSYVPTMMHDFGL